MRYGGFSDSGREFIIIRPDTPRPWVNCLTNGSYSAVISQTGGGYSFIGGPGYDRLTRSEPDFAVSDRPGRYIYVRDDSSGEYFSIGWQPVKREPDHFECRHTQGITTIASDYGGIRGSITFFVPLDDNLEIWRVAIENTRAEQADLSIFTYVEWVLGNYSDDLEQRQLSDRYNEAVFQDNYIVATKRAWRRPDSASITLSETKAAGGPKFLPETLSANQAWGKWAFIALSIPVDGFDCDRQAFLGRYGDLGSPLSVVKGLCSNSDGNGRDAVGVLQSRLVIPPGGRAEFDVFVGITIHKDDPSGVVARYGEPRVVEEKIEAVRRYWDGYISKMTVSTPDPDINRSVNIWDKYQAWVSDRSHGLASTARDGLSVISFKETCYDILGVLPMDPEAAKLKLVEIIQHQYRDGSAVHHWEPRSDVGTRTGHLDDAIWLIFAITSYLKETGDIEFLNDRMKYYYSQSPASVYEHLIKSIDFCLSQMSPRGLSLLGPGDWNDTLDEAGSEGVGESVLTSQMLCWALFEAAAVAILRDDRARSRAWVTKGRQIAAKINEVAWDESWYLRAFSDEGDEIGGTSAEAGRIYLATQVWSIISGVAESARATAAMKSVAEWLDTPYGPAALHPAYEKTDGTIGTITRLSPGTRDNGGISALMSSWAVLAECMLGRGPRAYELYRKTVVPANLEDQERYSSEPYAHAEFVDGPASETLGQGAFSWPSGIASWTWRTCIDWICGVRPDYGGLRVSPCVPPHWREFGVIRPFRDAIYRITIHNPDGLEWGVRKITVDGKTSRAGSPIHDFRDGKVHEVEVVMGQVPTR